MAEEIQNTDQTVESGENKVQESTEQARTFSQEEVNGLVAKESKKAQEKIFKSLGFEDIKSAKEGFEKLGRIHRKVNQRKVLKRSTLKSES